MSSQTDSFYQDKMSPTDFQPYRCCVSVSFRSDNLDRPFNGQTCPAEGRRPVPGGGGQLPAAEPHRSSDGRHLGRHEGRGGHLLRSAGRPEGEQLRRRPNTFSDLKSD